MNPIDFRQKGIPVSHNRRLGLLTAAVAASLAVASPASAAVTQIAGSGSSASVPYLEVLFKAYKKVDPSVKFVYTANNGNAGAADVQAGRSQFAIQTRPPLPSDSGLTYSKLFLDALTISVNPANKLDNLKIPDAKDIFTGKVTEWGPVSGLSGPISAFGRNSTAGLYTFFTSAVLGGDSQGTNVTPLDKDGEVAVAVSKNKSGIGYVGLANSGPGSGVKRLKINGIAPTPATIKNLRYPLSRYAWIVLPIKNPNRKVQKFADWIRSSYAAGQVITKAGAVPAFNATKPPKRKRR
jgi:phosphate transport system substrate-binding protein